MWNHGETNRLWFPFNPKNNKLVVGAIAKLKKNEYGYPVTWQTQVQGENPLQPSPSGPQTQKSMSKPRNRFKIVLF